MIEMLTLSPLYAASVRSDSGMFNVDTAKVLYLKGPVDEKMLAQAEKTMALDTEIDQPRLVIIDTVGGNVYEGQKIANALRRESDRLGQPIWCICVGEASSMGFNIMSQCHYRLGTPDTKYMFHRVAQELGPLKVATTFSVHLLRRYVHELEATEKPYTRLNSMMLRLSAEEYLRIADFEWTYATQYVLDRGWLDDLATLKE